MIEKGKQQHARQSSSSYPKKLNQEQFKGRRFYYGRQCIYCMTHMWLHVCMCVCVREVKAAS